MSWPNFDGKPYTRAQIAARIASLDFSQWKHKDGSHGKPAFITLHNTSEPDIKLWLSWGPLKRQQYINNMQPYYENMGWRGGPHFFVPPDADICAFGFNDLLAAGTHASCFNAVSIGIEMVGEFDREPFDMGAGALVRDNAIFLMAALHNRIGLNPEPYVYGKSGLHFHVECKADNHDCPGKYVHKADVITRLKAEMARQKGVVVSLPPAPTIPAPTPAPAPKRFTNITATMFGGRSDPNNSAYDGHLISDTELGCALPFHFSGVRPKVRVFKGDKSVVCVIVDVGPWNSAPGDQYWKTGERPLVETQFRNKTKAQNGRVPTNIAAIDLTPAAVKAIGLDGKGVVDWQFEP